MFQKQKQRKRPVRSCAVPTGFWDPVVLKPEASNSTVQIDGEEKAEEEEEEEVFRARPRMKNHEPAPPSFYSCYSEDTVSNSLLKQALRRWCSYNTFYEITRGGSYF